MMDSVLLFFIVYPSADIETVKFIYQIDIAIPLKLYA